MRLSTHRRCAITTITLLVLTLFGGGAAQAMFTASSQGQQHVAAASIPTPTVSSATVSGSIVELTFSPITLTGGRPLTYQAARLNATTSAVVATHPCSTVPGGCQVSDVPAGSWKFQVRGLYASWEGLYSTATSNVVIAEPATLTVVAIPQRQNVNFGRFTFTGSGSSGTTPISVTVYSNNTCTSSSAAIVTYSPAGSGSWGPSSSTANLGDDTTYWVKAVQGGNTSLCTSAVLPNYA